MVGRAGSMFFASSMGYSVVVWMEMGCWRDVPCYQHAGLPIRVSTNGRPDTYSRSLPLTSSDPWVE